MNRNARLAIGLVLSAFVIIVVAQNTHPVSTNILFWPDVQLPASGIGVVTLVFGYVLGLLSLRARRRGRIRKEAEARKRKEVRQRAKAETARQKKEDKEIKKAEKRQGP